MTRRQTTIQASSRSGHLRRTSVALATLLALGFAATANAQPTSNWLDYTAIAKTQLGIGSNIEVSGNYAVTQPGGRLTLGTNLYQDSNPPNSFLVADEMEFTGGASANNVYVNSLQLNGTAEVRGTTKPFNFPLVINVPPLPPGVTDSCANSAADVTVPGSQTRTLAPGCYRDLLVNHDAVVNLTGGDYIFRHLSLQLNAQVVAQSPTTLSVQQNLSTGIGSFLSPQSGNAAELMIFCGGASNHIGNDALFIGRIVAPNDTDLQFGVRTTFIGNAYADTLTIFGVHLQRTPSPTPTFTPKSTPTFTPFVPPTPTPTPTPTHTPGPTPTPTPPPTPTPTFTPFVPPTPTAPFVPPTPHNCGPSFTSPNPCT